MEKLIVDDGGLSSVLEKSGKIKSGGIFLEIFSRSILTCWNPAIRNVVSPDVPISCVMCGGGVETSTHLFLHLMVVDKVWAKVLKWLDFNFVTLRIFCSFGSLPAHLVWLASFNTFAI